MRAANFKMGSILPENNAYQLGGLEKNPSNAAIGLSKNTGGYRPQAMRNSPIKSQDVSAGNNIARGMGTFKTVNQEMTNWI